MFVDLSSVDDAVVLSADEIDKLRTLLSLGLFLAIISIS
jgi:hypothetical protein